MEDIFNVERVSKEFFICYKELFITLTHALNYQVQADKTIQKEFKQKHINTVDFSKKLLGQIVFIYFLQKKGWLGVKKDNAWGTGKRNFLRDMFTTSTCDAKEFFSDILQPLFYEALRIDRSYHNHYYERFRCRIPFLNGGLFDPLNNYDWEHSTITLANTIFSNTNKTKEGDIGDGILDIFDRFNFTIKEDEPLETEVAVDPELLGRIYERFNAIREDNFEACMATLHTNKEATFNKEYGVFYTPRKIVHYMCQQSLIEYVSTELATKNIPIQKQDIETLVLHAAQLLEHEKNTEKKTQETRAYTHTIPTSIRTNADTIDALLQTICICDPAVGSGAFLVGMMNEIITLRTLLAVYIATTTPNLYQYKRHCIEHSLHGVDIDAGATEIARLRLWLSLVVDEDGTHGIHPLPNLDYKIIAGDALLRHSNNIFSNAAVEELIQIHKQFTNETTPDTKQTLKEKITCIKQELYGQDNTFYIEVEFPHISSRTLQGFDIIIQNPPYRQLQTMNERIKQIYKKQNYKSFKSTGDIYCLFYERALELLKSSGHLCIITSNKWMRSGYGEPLRALLSTYNPKTLIDVGSNVFETATADTNILLIERRNVDAHNLQAHTSYKPTLHSSNLTIDALSTLQHTQYVPITTSLATSGSS